MTRKLLAVVLAMSALLGSVHLVFAYTCPGHTATCAGLSCPPGTPTCWEQAVNQCNCK